MPSIQINRATANPKGFLSKLDRECVIDNSCLRGIEKAVLTWLLARNPNEPFSFEKLYLAFNDGKNALKAALYGLRAKGFITQSQTRKADGTWFWHVEVNETPKEVPDEDVLKPDQKRVNVSEERLQETANKHGISIEILRGMLSDLSDTPMPSEAAHAPITATPAPVPTPKTADKPETPQSTINEWQRRAETDEKLLKLMQLQKSFDAADTKHFLNVFATGRTFRHTEYDTWKGYFINWLNSEEKRGNLNKYRRDKTKAATAPTNINFDDKVKELMTWKVYKDTSLEQFVKYLSEADTILTQALKTGQGFSSFKTEKVLEKRDNARKFLKLNETDPAAVINVLEAARPKTTPTAEPPPPAANDS